METIEKNVKDIKAIIVEDVVRQGDFIEKDSPIRVLRLEGNRIVVVPDSGEKS